MDAGSRREIGRKGGRAAHQRGTAHEWTPAEAREAGRKGGGVLLRSGDDIEASRLREVANTLDDIAATLGRIADNSGTTHPHLIRRMRECLARASRSVDRIEPHS
jgi:hypothetical protein